MSQCPGPDGSSPPLERHLTGVDQPWDGDRLPLSVLGVGVEQLVLLDEHAPRRVAAGAAQPGVAQRVPGRRPGLWPSTGRRAAGAGAATLGPWWELSSVTRRMPSCATVMLTVTAVHGPISASGPRQT